MLRVIVTAMLLSGAVSNQALADDYNARMRYYNERVMAQGLRSMNDSREAREQLHQSECHDLYRRRTEQWSLRSPLAPPARLDYSDIDRECSSR
jgi:hypothetical protein